MAQDLVKSEVELPALMTAGRWKSAKVPRATPSARRQDGARWPSITRRAGVRSNGEAMAASIDQTQAYLRLAALNELPILGIQACHLTSVPGDRWPWVWMAMAMATRSKPVTTRQELVLITSDMFFN